MPAWRLGPIRKGRESMNIEEIRALAELVQASDLTALEVSEGNLRIRLERQRPAEVQEPLRLTLPLEQAPALPQAPAPALPQAPAQVQVPAPAQPQPQLAPPLPSNGPGVDFNRLTEVKSPMVGVFYAARSPEAQPFVAVGDRVKKGDTLCILEAMKLMNEIQAEQDGEIVDICAQNGQMVEYGQTLFKIY